MGSRYAIAVLGSVILAGAITSLASAVEPEEAGAATTVRTCGGGSITLSYEERQILVLQNRARKVRGLRPLCVDPRLTRAARSHSQEMVWKDYFSHSSYNGESVGERLKRFGYARGVYGENLTGGSSTGGTPAATFQRWMNSPGHKANILDDRYQAAGVGTYTGTYKERTPYTMYTVDFGVRR
jgi:uncharacterized protein YkwD